ncbi:MAG: hypothetical protein WCO56_24500 [Verrucomicrobiota bacterium]
MTGVLAMALAGTAFGAGTPVESLTFNGQVDTNQASFMLTGRLRGSGPEEVEPKLIYSLSANARVTFETELISQTCELKAKIHQGRLKELVLAMRGNGEVTNVAGSDVKDWSIRSDGRGGKFLVIRPTDLATNVVRKELAATIHGRLPFKKLPVDFSPLSFVPENAALFDGALEIKPTEAVELAIANISGLMLVRTETTVSTEPRELPLIPNQPFQFRFAGGEYGLSVQVRERDADGRKVIWDKFQMTGELKPQNAAFTLSGEAVVRHPEGGTLAVLAGDAALTDLPTGVEMTFDQGRYLLRFRKPGIYPIALKFNAKVTPQDVWNSVNFEVVASSLRPVVLKGLPSDTQFQFAGAAKPERQGEDFVSFLPSAGRVQLQWKEAKREELGKLFYSVQGTVHMAMGPGLLRQAYLMDYRVMQGELTQLIFDLTGEGEVTRIRGNDILSWKVEGTAAAKNRRLLVQLNQPCKDSYQVVIQLQTPLGVFPVQVQPLRLAPVQAIRYGGHLLVVNDGAVRLEVTDTKGLSQISPDIFPQSKELQEAGVPRGSQAFAYRFAGGDYSLTLQADHILPELSISQVLLYHLGETETAIDAELELEIRDAPLREFNLRIPSDFSVSKLQVAQLADYFVTAEPNTGWSKLRLVFTAPLTGRQIIQLRLGKNQTANAGAWALPVLQPQGVKSVRGFVGVSADTGFRLTPGRLSGLTEIATAFFPKKIAGLQQAWRLREDNWEASVNVERLTLTVQVDGLHLFTVKDGIVYGSSVINYLIAGAPVSMLKIVVPAEYGNIEFSGKDVRNWKKADTGYEVYLHTPVYGNYTLLATYDHQLNTRSNTVAFDGARPLDVQAEQGSVLVVSDYQFEVKPIEISTGLIQLDPAEIPPEHRLLFDSPILAAYQYTARPFTLKLALNSLAPGETMHQVADRAVLNTHISREGEVVTTANYFVKNQGYAHLRVTLPEGTELWEAKVNGKKVVPVLDQKETLIPLPPKSDPSAILNVEVKLASKSPDKTRIKLETPTLKSPVLQTEWRLVPDEQYRLQHEGGSVAPIEEPNAADGFAVLHRLMAGAFGMERKSAFFAAPLLLLVGAFLLRMGTRPGTFRWSPGNVIGTGLGLFACGIGIFCLANLAVGLADLVSENSQQLSPALTLIAPIQEAGQAIAVQVHNQLLTSSSYTLWPAWPALLAVGLWLYLAIKGVTGGLRKAGVMLGWTLIAWAALRAPNGMPAFLITMMAFAFIHVVIPALRCQWKLPRETKPVKPAEPPPAPPAAGIVTALLLMGLFFAQAAAEPSAVKPDDALKSIVQSVIQDGKVQEGFVVIKAQLTWKTEAGQRLDFLTAPAILMKVDYPQNALLLTESKTGDQGVYRLTAKEAGQFEIRFEYQLVLPKDSASSGFLLPTPHGLVNRLQLEVDRAEAEVYSEHAVAVESSRIKRGEQDFTRADLVLAPLPKTFIGWKPRARDPRLEKAVFYGELHHLYIPTPGVVEGVHWINVRPAQGQLAEIAFQVPGNLTITDVQADFVSSWRFDPDTKVLRAQFTTPQSRPFQLKLRSQLVAGTLPYEQTVGVITLNQAAGQIGMAAVATGPEVQLDATKETGMSVINLEDFPPAINAETARQIPGLTVRRAYRYSEATAQLTISAAAVQPDVRVDTQDTLSLGEDRTLLVSQLSVNIARAGIFKLTFALPADFEVETLTGTALSHWTEMKAEGGRVITMHLRGKTEGNTTFNITLTGPGLANKKTWEAPRLTLREATKQTGQLVLVPEQGIRLHIKQRDGLTQLDPKRIGQTQKGSLAFRLLQSNWQLGFDIETVEPWIQLTTLQDVNLREGQAMVTAQFDFQITNAGVKSLNVQVPAGAENVRFEGDFYSDSVKLADDSSRWVNWEVKLQRRVIGGYALRLTYQLPLTNQASEVKITGVKSKTANLHRGYLAVRAGGRLQIKLPRIPTSLQPAEWQAIPATLRRGRELAEAKDTFSILENDFELTLGLTRHKVANLLSAQVESLNLTSVVAPSGEMLTEGRLMLQPGDKRLLRIKLPANSKFWYAFVNGQSAWPWLDNGQTLLLLEKNSEPGKPTSVEFFYTCETGATARDFNHQALGPSFDLPLENITWNVYLPPAWKLKEWESTLQLQAEGQTIMPGSINVENYLESETSRNQKQSKEAEGLLQMGNTFLQQGTPQQARRAYQAAWKMSSQDAAFNEDARVQLHNLKMQQALLGLNQRRQNAFESLEKKDGKTARTPFARWEPGQIPDYTQQQAQQALEQNAAEDNTALYRLAERLIGQQSAGGGKPESIRAALPIQGHPLTFTGSLQVKPWSDLIVKLDIVPIARHAWMATWRLLGGVFIVLLILAFAVRDPKTVGK